MKKDSVSSKSNTTDQARPEASSETRAHGEGEDYKVSDDDVVGEEYLHIYDSGSSSVLGGPDISDHAKKQIVESLKMKPIMIKKVKKTKCIRVFGVDMASEYFEYIVVHNPEPLRRFDPSTGQFVPDPLHDPVEQRGGHVENAEPQNPRQDNFSRLLQNIEARFGARPVFLYEKKLTKSDISSNLNRLFINRSRKLMRFLREEERRRVEDEDKNIWLDVLATDPAGESYELHLKLWRSLHMVVLNGKNWNTVVIKNKLEAGYVLELWAYREQEDTELRLAMNFNKLD